MINRKFEAMLFDFDGTLADTSFDMVNCLNILLKKHSIPEVSSDTAKNYISKGAGGLIDFSCPGLSENKRKVFISEYLNIYKENIFVKTHLFDGVSEIIETLVIKSCRWGIVTNKPGYLVKPIIKMLNLCHHPHCVVSGDTLSVKKPSPEPLLYASKLLSCNPLLCAYVGDDIRDIKAANAAGMFSIAASYGFIKNKDHIKEWGSDYTINSPLDLKNLIT